MESQWKERGRAYKLGGKGSQGITRVVQTVLARLMEAHMVPACGQCGQMAHKRNNGLCWHFCLGESCPCSHCPDAGHFSSSLYVLAAPMLELRESESE